MNNYDQTYILHVTQITSTLRLKTTFSSSRRVFPGPNQKLNEEKNMNSIETRFLTNYLESK